MVLNCTLNKHDRAIRIPLTPGQMKNKKSTFVTINLFSFQNQMNPNVQQQFQMQANQQQQQVMQISVKIIRFESLMYAFGKQI